MIDLNELGASWIDLDNPSDPGTNWIAVAAAGINNSGKIAGTAQHQLTLDERVFLLDFTDDGAVFTVLPKVGNGFNRACDINDHGVIVGHNVVFGEKSDAVVYTPWSGYAGVDLGVGVDTIAHINNVGEIVGRKGAYIAPDAGSYPEYTYTPGAFRQVADRWFYGINDSGVACGSRGRIRGKNGQEGGPILRDLDSGVELSLIPEGGGAGITVLAAGVNNDNDASSDYGRGYLYSTLPGADGQPLGLLSIDSLLVNADAAWSDTSRGINLREVNARDATGFPQISGWTGNLTTSGRAFLLTPQAVSGN